MESNLILKELDEARQRAGLSKTELARLAGTQPSSVRRLLSGGGHNPQFSTLAALAEVLGLEIRVMSVSEEEHKTVIDQEMSTATASDNTTNLPTGHSTNPFDGSLRKN